MNRIVREHYPASRLPEDLRPSNDPAAQVTVIVEEEARPEKVLTLEEIFSLTGFRRRSMKEIIDDIRAMRED
jgi:hypothetical protein